MKVKFGFLVDALRGVGITNPEHDFIVARVKNWIKKKGDNVAVGDLIAEVETDKVTGDFNSVWSGKILSLSYGENDNWEVGVDKDGNELSERAEDTPYGRMLLPELGYIETTETTEITETTETKETTEITEITEIKEITKTNTRVRAAPAARKLAAEHGIDINSIKGTGMGGRVMRTDVEQAIETMEIKETTETTETKETKEIPDDRELLNASLIRKAIAYYMAKSHAEIPKAGDAITVDVTNLREFYRQRRQTWREDTGTDFSFTGIFMFIAARLLSDKRDKFGIINAYWDKDIADAYLFKRVNIGIALQGPDGLMVPVIPSAEKLCFRDILAATYDKIERVRSKKIALSELRDLTFTVNNVGAMGGENPDSIVPYVKESGGKERPTGMILVLGAIKKSADGREHLTLAFSFDHRLFDGAPALQFVNEIKKYIESKESAEDFRELFDPEFNFNQ